MSPALRVALNKARYAVYRDITEAIGLTVREVGFGSSPAVEKIYRVEKHALRELAFFLIDGAA